MARAQFGGSTTTPCQEFAAIDEFRSIFQMRAANNDKDRNAAYALRYQIYCLENPFEDPGQFPDGREKDALDDRSLHGIVMHKRSKILCGTARLVMPRRNEDEEQSSFFSLCKEARWLPQHSTAEVSRFSSSKVMKRQCELFPDTQAFTEHDALLPYITVSLIAFILQSAVQNDVTHLCAVMKPALIRLLSRFGVNFQTIGEPVEYHGLRQPCFLPMDKLLMEMEREHPMVFDIATDNGRIFDKERRVKVA